LAQFEIYLSLCHSFRTKIRRSTSSPQPRNWAAENTTNPSIVPL